MTKRKKVLCVFGTRPEAVKMATVVHALKAQRRLTVRVCVTAQHRSMLDSVLKIFGIRPDHDLGIMREGQTLEHITAEVIRRFSPVLKKEKPDLVLVHGDTTTTLLASLASFYQKVPVGHVEAGLRSYDFENPFPEEANRRLGDALCRLHFAPTESSRRNLLSEKIPAKGIYVTGNTVIDALRWAVKKPHRFKDAKLKDFLNRPGRLILVTAHRRENFGEPLREICRALRAVVELYPDVRLVYPVHLNPNVREVVHSLLARHPRILLCEPLGYLDFCHLIRRSHLVVTDSGGLQEEAPSLGKPVLVLRKVTERPEAVRSGTTRVVGTKESAVFANICRLLDDRAAYRKMASAVNPYGDGRAAGRIVQAILHFFGLSSKKPGRFSPRD